MLGKCLWHIRDLLPYIDAIHPTSLASGFVNPLVCYRLTTHFAVLTILQIIGAILMRQDAIVTILLLDNLRAGILSVGALHLHLVVAIADVLLAFALILH